MEKMPIAAQVYSVREEAGVDFAGTMKQLKSLGYDGVELAGLYGRTPDEIKGWLEEAGLTPIGAHVPFDEFDKDLENTVRAYHSIGCSYVAIPSISEDRRYGGSRYEEFLAAIPVIAAECRKYGMKLLYHNHGFEFEKTADGKTPLDELYASQSPEDLETELDTCWIKVAGKDPLAYLEKYRMRCPLVHIKDFIQDGEVKLVAVGDGVQDIKAIAEKAQECGAQWLVVEQDSHIFGSPMENMKKSICCLRSMME